jgi:hypothetical protein
MLYQLPNGKCIEISIEQYLRMSDQDFNMYIAYNIGEEINDPFAYSVLRYGSISEKEDDEFHKMIEESLIDEEEEYIEDLTDISDEEKLLDDEFIDYDNIEP